MGLNLLEKTELWVNEITLANANLSDMADAVAEQLGLDKGKVMVVDVRPRHITFDVLERNVPQAGIMGKERAILSALAALPGVCLTDKSYIHSNGILGLICADVEEPEAVLDRVSNMTREIQEKVSRRAIVFPTGFELKQGMIQDTNTPFLKHELEERGYYVTVGEVMEDNVEDVVEKLDDALSRGFGLIVTTGGVGAEDKDHSVEGVCRMDPTAATPYIVKFQQGTGRHVKDGVRIGVGVVGPSRMVGGGAGRQVEAERDGAASPSQPWTGERMKNMDHKQAAQMLWEAEQGRYQIDMLTQTHPEMTVEDAYAVQLENVRRREAAGERAVGMKIGLTSVGMQQLLHVHEPDYGHLFENMLLQPKMEGELSFCLGKSLQGPGITVADVYDAIEWVTPSIEIVDSRIKDWKIRLPDTIADNGSSTRFMLGGRMMPIGAVDMRLTGMTLEQNGVLLSSGTTAEVWGNPAASVAWLANKLGQFGISLKAGSIVMAGAVTAAVPAKAGDVFTVSFQGMGSVTVRFVDEPGHSAPSGGVYDK